MATHASAPKVILSRPKRLGWQWPNGEFTHWGNARYVMIGGVCLGSVATMFNGPEDKSIVRYVVMITDCPPEVFLVADYPSRDLCWRATKRRTQRLAEPAARKARWGHR